MTARILAIAPRGRVQAALIAERLDVRRLSVGSPHPVDDGAYHLASTRADGDARIWFVSFVSSTEKGDIGCVFGQHYSGRAQAAAWLRACVKLWMAA